MTSLDMVVASITGLVSGAVASLVAPWVKWRIQRVRDRTEYRRQQIRRWREAIDSFDFESGTFGDTVVYAELRPYLDEDFRRGLESGRTLFVPAEGRGYAMKHRILDIITKRERKWGIRGVADRDRRNKLERY